MRVLVACEFSGIVRDAFRALGHYAISCDLLDTIEPGPHLMRDVRELLLDGMWDLMIAHPPCTYLAVSGNRWMSRPGRAALRDEAVSFFRLMTDAPVPRSAVENPVGVMSTLYRKPDQVIQPWQFGHGEVKATCLWLKNLPKLQPTNIVDGREAVCHRASPGPDRWKFRSLTYKGVAAAMAAQWGAASLSGGLTGGGPLGYTGGP